MGWLQAWFGYGIGVGVSRALFGKEARPSATPIRPQTEEEIRADERRYDEDEKRLDANDAAAKQR